MSHWSYYKLSLIYHRHIDKTSDCNYKDNNNKKRVLPYVENKTTTRREKYIQMTITTPIWAWVYRVVFRLSVVYFTSRSTYILFTLHHRLVI